MTLLAGDARECPRGVDQGHDGQAKAVGQPHQSQGFPIPLGVGTAEIAAKVFFGIAPFLVSKKDDPLLVEGGQTTDQGPVFAKGAVSPELEDIGCPLLEVVEEVGALGVTDDLDPLPGGEVSVHLATRLGPFFLEGGDFRFCAEFLFARKFSKFFDPFFQIRKRLFKLQWSDGLGFGHRCRRLNDASEGGNAWGEEKVGGGQRKERKIGG